MSSKDVEDSGRPIGATFPENNKKKPDLVMSERRFLVLCSSRMNG